MASGPLVMMQVVGTVDRRTTIVCLHAIGMMVEPGTPFDTLAGQFDHPPFHINCRSFVVPWQPGYARPARAAANKELQKRPAVERRIGPAGPTGRIPPPAAGNGPVASALIAAATGRPSAPAGGSSPAAPASLARRRRVRDVAQKLAALIAALQAKPK